VDLLLPVGLVVAGLDLHVVLVVADPLLVVLAGQVGPLLVVPAVQVVLLVAEVARGQVGHHAPSEDRVQVGPLVPSEDPEQVLSGQVEGHHRHRVAEAGRGLHASSEL